MHTLVQSAALRLAAAALKKPSDTMLIPHCVSTAMRKPHSPGCSDTASSTAYCLLVALLAALLLLAGLHSATSSSSYCLRAEAFAVSVDRVDIIQLQQAVHQTLTLGKCILIHRHLCTEDRKWAGEEWYLGYQDGRTPTEWPHTNQPSQPGEMMARKGPQRT